MIKLGIIGFGGRMIGVSRYINKLHLGTRIEAIADPKHQDVLGKFINGATPIE